jgi:hypothetical protein
MFTIISRIAKKAKITRHFEPADIRRMVAYNNRHPMWIVGADERAVAAYNAILSDARRAGMEV